jgi:DnaJ-domain-containing protein 1
MSQDRWWQRLTQAPLRERLTDAARKNLNQIIDAVEDFEDRGGFSKIVDQLQTTGGYDQKSLRQYYANLEVPYDSDLEVVKKSYRNLMRRYHPDRHSADPEREKLSTALSQELTRAYDAVVAHLRRQGRA